MRVIASWRKISGSMTYDLPPRCRSRRCTDGTFTYSRGSTAASSKNEPRRVIAGPQRSICVTWTNSSSHTKYARLPCSWGVRAVLTVVIAAAVVEGKIVVASMSCARSPRSARSRSDRMNGTSPCAASTRSWPIPSPSARTITTCRAPAARPGSRALSGGGSSASRAPSTSSIVAATLTSPPPV